MLAPLGLHFFLAYQEFAFYCICSYYRAFAKRVLATSEEEQKCFQVLPTQPNQRAEEKNTVVDDALNRTINGNLEELEDIMKNMTQTFGPFLLQNFSLMLLYWLLHLYFLVYSVIITAKGLIPMASVGFQFGGSVLIVR